MKYLEFNAKRLSGVSEKQWREALDEVTAYLRWRLAGKTQRGAHSEKELGMPALDYYQEEAVVKLIEGEWKWQERFTLGKQLEKIAADLVTKQVQKWERAHPLQTEDGRWKMEDVVPLRKPELIEFTDDIEQYGDAIDDDGQKELDETYEKVFVMVADDKELTLYVEAIVHCNRLDELPGYLGVTIQKVYRLQEKLMRRINRAKERGVL